MPVIPQSEPRREIPVPRIESTFQNPDPYSQLAVKALDLHERVSTAYEEMEATRIAGEAGLGNAVKIAQEQYGNPDEFAQKAGEVVQQKYEGAIQSAGNDLIRQKVISKLSDNYRNARDAIAFGVIRKKHDIALGDWDKQKVDKALQFAAGDDAAKATILQDFEGQLLSLSNQNIIDKKNLDVERKDFGKKVAGATMEANPSLFLKQLSTGVYDKILDPIERLSVRRTANELIHQDILIQDRELKLEGRKADSVLQKMLDDGAPLTDIEAKLKEYSAVNVLDSGDRQKWENRLKNSQVKDSPTQVQNANKLLADFKSQYPTYSAVKRARDEANAMRGDGRLGEAGASQILGFINQTQSHLAAEGRAEASAARARTGSGIKTTDTQAKAIISENFPTDRGTYISKAHKDDITRFNDATIGRGQVDKAEIARKIRDDRAKVIRENKARNAAVQALPPDEAAALKALRGGK